jgi:hypothetical protein
MMYEFFKKNKPPCFVVDPKILGGITHAKLKKAHAEGALIERYHPLLGSISDSVAPRWFNFCEYRIKQ